MILVQSRFEHLEILAETTGEAREPGSEKDGAGQPHPLAAAIAPDPIFPSGAKTAMKAGPISASTAFGLAPSWL